MVGAIVLAGGKGTRYKKKKQFELISGIEMWKYVYKKVCQVVNADKVVVVGIDVEAGETRSQSVKNGLEALNGLCNRVIIVEAARPMVSIEQIKILAEDTHSSSTFVMPLVNTIIGRDGTYYNRNDFYDLLTPQAFDYELLKKAYNTGKYYDTTDETYVMHEEYGILPYFIEDGENLIKVTYQRDIEIINKLIERGKK